MFYLNSNVKGFMLNGKRFLGYKVKRKYTRMVGGEVLLRKNENQSGKQLRKVKVKADNTLHILSLSTRMFSFTRKNYEYIKSKPL